MRIDEFISRLKIKLQSVYDEREAENIARYLPEELFGKIFIRNHSILTGHQLDILEEAMERLLNHEPVQYILGEAWFYGKKFRVNSAVLIPRPETEELIELILEENKYAAPAILDIGTGSGCIPIILKSELRDSVIYSIDISEQALQIATENARLHHTEIQFIKADILNDEIKGLPVFDLIVSNPPYIDPSEQLHLDKNVLDHEPQLALFAPEEEPLIFYRMISAFAMKHLKPGGKLFFEIPANKSAEIETIVFNAGFKNIKIKSDMQGNDRMLRAEKI